MRILVTGGSGLLGSSLAQCETDSTVLIARREDADLRDFSQVESLLRRQQPDAVIHAAALVGGIGGNLMKSGEYFFENTQINLNVLEASRQAGITNLVAFMSTCVFPNQATFPLTIEQLHAGPPHESNFGYAYSKRMLEVQMRAYNHQWGTTYKLLVPANMYGTHDNFNLLEGHVIPALIHKTFRARESGGPLEIWGSGKAQREFVFAPDVARIALDALKIEIREPLIVSTGQEVTISELVHLVTNTLDYHGEIRFDISKPDGQLRKPSHIEPFRKSFKDFEFTPLPDGLKKTVDWFLHNYPNIRQ